MSRILFGEDEAHLAQGLRFNFEAEGHGVQTTDRGEEALAVLVEKKEKVEDFRNLQLRAGGKTVQLTVMEADLLRYLIRNVGHPVSRKAILQDVWNLHEETDTRAIDSFIVRLRKYIEPKPSKPRYLLTIRGLGYQFVAKSKD